MNATTESPNLDFLRSVAIGAVLVDHCSRQLGHPGYGAVGRAGVLLFFVHTALVLMFSLERLNSRGGSTTIPFYIQRFFRIYPLCWACIVVFVVFQVPPHVVPPHTAGVAYHWGGWRWLAINLLLIQNVTFSSFVSGPLWSLPYEVQMYLALPFIYKLARKRIAVWSISAICLCAVVFTIALNRFYMGLYGPHYDDSLHSPLTVFVPCFLGGVFAFILSKRKHLNLPFWLLPPALLGFFVLIFHFPVRTESWIGCTAIGILLPQICELHSRTIGRVCHGIAKYSYGVYLTHTPLLWLMFHHFPRLPSFARWIGFSGLLVIVSVASYQWIERPGIDIGRRLAKKLASRKHPDPENVIVVPLAVGELL
jgi:peptidoglycan/LPS O-acetylase OafA/YrhL